MNLSIGSPQSIDNIDAISSGLAGVSADTFILTPSLMPNDVGGYALLSKSITLSNGSVAVVSYNVISSPTGQSVGSECEPLDGAHGINVRVINLNEKLDDIKDILDSINNNMCGESDSVDSFIDNDTGISEFADTGISS